MIWREALDSSWMVADSSSAVALICSAEAASTRPVRAASAIRASACAAIWPCSSDLACSCTAACASLAADDCSSAALATRVAPFSASVAARSASSAVGQGLLAAVGDLLHVRAQAVQRPRPRRRRPSIRSTAASAACCRAVATSRTSAWIAVGKLLHLLRALLGGLGERAHFVGDDREAAAVIAGARRFDGRVQRQQIGLVGDTADRAGDLADVLGAPLELAR